MAQKYLFIAISFYLNIVCKNIVCDVGLIGLFCSFFCLVWMLLKWKKNVYNIETWTRLNVLMSPDLRLRNSCRFCDHRCWCVPSLWRWTRGCCCWGCRSRERLLDWLLMLGRFLSLLRRENKPSLSLVRKALSNTIMENYEKLFCFFDYIFLF